MSNPLVWNTSIGAPATAEVVEGYAEGHNKQAMVFGAEGADFRVQIGADASENGGELVYEGTTATFTGLQGKKVSVWTATADAPYSAREIQ